MTPRVPDPIEPKDTLRIPKWVVAVPGLLMVAFFGVRAMIGFGGASRVIGGDQPSSKPSLACVSTYGVTFTNSEYYVREGQQYGPPPTTPELSTVVSGMVRNDCADAVKSVWIHMTVRDDNGKKGDGSVQVLDLGSGQAKPFSKAWMGRISSYEIDKIQ